MFYIAADDMDRFAASFLATFGGRSSQPGRDSYADAEFRVMAGAYNAGRRGPWRSGQP